MSTQERLPRLPYLLLGAMSLVSFVGPFVLLVALNGGASGKWPPDRTIEWAAVIVVFGLVVVLFMACVSIGWWHHQAAPAREPRTEDVHL